MAANPSILIAMPLYRGWPHVREALQSIKDQTYPHYRVLISVDGGDERSYEACRSFLDDPRFEIVMHQEHLQWHGNMDWLAGQLREDFFCYWQHDDHCEPDYLEALVDHARDHPEAAAIYCDMDVYGEMERLVELPSTTGAPLDRVMRQVDFFNPAVIRCLVRADAMQAARPIKLVFTWGMAIARLGDLHRVPKLLYHRRIRKKSLTFSLPERAPEAGWRDALDWGLGFIGNVYPLVPASDRDGVFAGAVDRLVNQSIHKKWLHDFEPDDEATKHRFVLQLLTEAADQFGWRPYPDLDADELEALRNRGGLAPGEDRIIAARLAALSEGG